jgi:hypothetical protein
VGQALEERLGPTYFDRHFQDLGEIALGPLMLRKSAAAAAKTLSRAVEALDAEQLREDAAAAFRAASDHLFQVYRTVVEAMGAERRLGAETVEDALATPDERQRLSDSFARNSELLDSALERVLARQHILLQRLQASEHATPETEDASLEEAAEEWREEILTLDRAYGAAWSDVVIEIADIWSERLIPRLRHLATLRGARLSENARLAILATATFTAVAVLAWLIF